MTANWPTWWREVRAMCDTSPDGSVELSIDQIAQGADSRDKSLRERWWWASVMDPDNGASKGVLENGMACEPLPASGPVDRVVFRVHDHARP